MKEERDREKRKERNGLASIVLTGREAGCVITRDFRFGDDRGINGIMAVRSFFRDTLLREL